MDATRFYFTFKERFLQLQSLTRADGLSWLNAVSLTEFVNCSTILACDYRKVIARLDGIAACYGLFSLLGRSAVRASSVLCILISRNCGYSRS